MPNDTPLDAKQLPHVLVIDDSRLMRRAIGKLLGKLYRVSEAGDGEEGLNFIQSTDDIKLVFSDLSMPKLDGYGLLDKIRNSDDPRISALPVIVITGAEDSDETKQKALAHGASDFISKPFDSAQLRARAKTHIQLDETHRKLSETETKLEQQSTLDELTGLGNKNRFEQRGNQNLAYAKRHQSVLSVLRLDIDNFNRLFMRHGKEAANAVLKQVSNIALNHVRHEDTAARIGVAKLAFILPSTDHEGALRLAQRICNQVQELNFKFNNTPIAISASIGVTTPDINPQLTLGEILKIAEKHLGIAIEQGGNQVIASDKAASPPAEAEPQDLEQSQHNESPIESSPEAVVIPVPNLDSAADQAQSEHAERLTPHLAVLLKRILPLLKLCNTKLSLGIDEAIITIEKRLP